MKSIVIKKLKPQEVEEGLTLELVNSVDISKNYSPIMLGPGDEPVNILEFSKGFWIMIDGNPLQNEQNKNIELSVRDCQIGRARYYLNHGKELKAKEVEVLINEWKRQVTDALDKINQNINYIGFELSVETFQTSNSDMYFLAKLQKQKKHEELERCGRLDDYLADLRKTYYAGIELHATISQRLKQGAIVECMELLGIRRFGALMLSVNTNSSRDIKVLVNCFSAAALESWSDRGYDMTYKYAQIEVEKKYPF